MADAVSFTSKEEITYFQVAALKAGMKLMGAGIKPHRTWTKAKALSRAGEITGRSYTKRDWAQAIIDLQMWIDEYNKPLG